MSDRDLTAREFPRDLRVDWPVVVLNTHHSGLAIARDLGRLGVHVLGLTAVPEFPGNASRWLQYRPAPDSLREQQQLLVVLQDLARELDRPALLLPTRDHDVNFIARHRAALDDLYLIAQLPEPELDLVMNKEALNAVARSVGISVAEGVTVRKAEELVQARALRFPCICKPLYASQWRRDGVWDAVGRQKALKLESYAALETFYGGFSHLDPLVTVQEWIEGDEEHLQIFGSVCNAEHEVTAWFTARKRLQYPPLAGTGIVVEALPLPDLEQPSRELLRAVAFRGVSEIEYKRDARNGRLYLIEINPRHWDQHGLGAAAGVNLSEALYRQATGQPPRSMHQVDEPTLWIAEAEYARHLARCALGRAPLRDAALGLGKRRTWSVYDPSDLRPLLVRMGLSRIRRQGSV